MTAAIPAPRNDGFGPDVIDPGDEPGDVAGWINEKSIEAWAREEATIEPLTPVQCEAAIQWCQYHMVRGVQIIRAFQKEWLEADAAFDRAYALAFLRYVGPQTEKRQAAEVDPTVMRARDARDVAKLAYEHSKNTQRRLEKELSGFQSLNKSMGAAYGAHNGFGG